MISIIVPVYKAENYITQTIDTVVNQTYSDWELILVDDKSPDRSAEVIADKLKQLPAEVSKKIRLIRKDVNEGAARARNTGLDVAKGRYIAFLDADDLWNPQKLEMTLSFMDKYQAAFVFTSYEFGDENGVPTGKRTRVPKTLTYKEALSRTVIFTSTVLLDSHKIDKSLMYMPDIGSEDTATWWQILKSGVTAYGLNMPLAIYRRPANSLSSNKKTAVHRIWNLYREVAGLSKISAARHMLGWAWRATVRRAIDDAVLNHFESIKRFLTVQLSVIGIILQTVLYAYAWFQVYYPIISGPRISQDGYNFGYGIKLYFRGHALILIIYFLVLLFIAKANGGLKTGYHRPMQIFGSLVISLVITNAVTYAQMSLMGNWLLTAVPMILLTLAQSLLALGWCYLTDYIYHHVFPPRDTLVIRGVDAGDTDAVVGDLMTRQDRFKVMKVLSVSDQNIDQIEEECLRWYGCVVLYGVVGRTKEALLKFCYGHYLRVYLVPDTSDLLLQGSEQMDLLNTPILELKEYSIRWENRILKRIFDFVGSLVAIVVTSPVLLVQSHRAKNKTGSAFQTEEVLGIGGKVIQYHTLSIPGFGHTLPSLLDVLKGRMSLVGPEPLPRKMQESLMDQCPEYFYRLRVKPGFTGVSQKKGLCYRDGADNRNEDAFKMDLFYVEHYSIGLDLKTLLSFGNH